MPKSTGDKLMDWMLYKFAMGLIKEFPVKSRRTFMYDEVWAAMNYRNKPDEKGNATLAKPT